MELYHEIESAVLSSLSKWVSETLFNLWFKDLVIEHMEGKEVTLSTISDFKATIIKEHHLDKVKQAFYENLGFPMTVHITTRVVDMEEERKKASLQPDPIEIEEEEEDLREKLEMTRNIEGKDQVSGYTFDNFIVGDSNRFAHAACFAVAQSFTTDEDKLTDPLEERINPLFIYGQSGLGKTHLLYAVTNEIKKRTPDVHFIYIRGEDFVNELIESLKSNTTADFRRKYRNTDVLLIDDIHFIAGKESIQEEFFNTFNTLHDNQKQIILTSDRPPCEIKNLTDRLRTRFEWGLMADIQPPTPELRSAIIKMKAEKLGITLSDDIVSYMADKIKSNIRTIEGAIVKLNAMNVLTGIPISLESAKRSLADMQSGTGENTFIIDRIFTLVSKRFNIPIDTIKGKRRQADIVFARQMCMYLIRTKTNYPLTDIGSIFGCNHSNVILSCNKIETAMENDPSIREHYDAISAQLNQ